MATDKYVVVWTDTRDGNQNIYLQKIDATNGSLAGANLQVTTDAANQEGPSISSETAGNTLLINWDDARDANPTNIYGRKYNAATGLLEGELIYSKATAIQSGPVNIFSPALSKFVTLWEDHKNVSKDILGRQFN